MIKLGVNLTSVNVTVARFPIRYLSLGLAKNTEKSANMQENNDILIKDINDKGIIILNRPKTLNVLNISMVQKIDAILKKWETTKKFVIVEGAGGKAFCAGGDVKQLATFLKETDGKNLCQQFFRNEYTLNNLIGTYKKPYLAFIDGITMGGGVGLSIHGRYRIATEKCLFAMPETAIGLVPDVGATYFLSKLKGKLGLFLGLTGSRLKGIDVLRAGIATHFVQSDRLPDLKEALLTSNTDDINEILNKYQPNISNYEYSLAPHLQQIDNCFSAASVEEIIKRLQADNSEWAENIVQLLHKMSPTALKATKKAIELGANLNLKECLKMEFRLTSSVMNKNSDFFEGVRALLIDKDQKPAWNPKSLEEVTDEYVNQHFKALNDKMELQL